MVVGLNVGGREDVYLFPEVHPIVNGVAALKYDNLFEQNANNGSFYLQSKVHRAKECLEAVYQGKFEGTN
nr:mitochondrial import inner membrane translocase subunit PAM16 like 2-like [Ipomoea batatas]GMD56029.1 mitochondrial import inner membrane translocase subunit PAM16 like 2-like [Ipomoea batatas]